MSKHARHIKVRTFGGILSDQTFFHMCWSCASKECSPVGGLFSLSATWYVFITENTWFLFSFHFKLSLEFKSPLLHRKMSFTVDWVNMAANKLRFHWLVFSLTRSRTLKHVFAPSRNCGGRGSHLWELIPIELPSLTSYNNPSLITSQAWSKLRQTKEGFVPNSASMNVLEGK